MSQRLAFRLDVTRLEERLVPSTLGGTSAPQALVGGVAPASTTPTPVNYVMPASSWFALHSLYAAQARRGGADVVFLGDSITYLWGNSTTPGPGTAAFAQDFSSLRARAFGVPGDLTQQLLWRVENGELAGRPKVAVVLIGINNLSGGESPADTVAGVRAVLDAIHAESPTTRVLLLGLLPAAQSAADPIRAEIAAVNAALAGPTNGTTDRFLNVGNIFLQPDGSLSGPLMPDGVHPSAAGYQLLADAIHGPLRALLANHASRAPTPVNPSPSDVTAPVAPAAPPAVARNVARKEAAQESAPVVLGGAVSTGPVWFLPPDAGTTPVDPTTQPAGHVKRAATLDLLTDG